MQSNSITLFYVNKLLFFFIPLFFVSVQAKAYSLRQYSSKNGLSNSAILSVHQDHNGFIWFGSCDGLNRFDGLDLQIHKAVNDTNNLSGNLIENIIETENDILWVQTNYGLDKFDVRNNSIQSFKEFKRKSHLAVTQRKDLLIINEDNYISWYDKQTESIVKIPVPGLRFYDILDITVSSDDILRVFMKGVKSISFIIRYIDNVLILEPAEEFIHEEELLYCFHENDQVWFIDKTYSLYEYNLNNRKKYYVYDLHKEISQHGEVSALVKFQDDYYIGFKTSGLLGLIATPEQKTTYRIADIDIRSGIFCLVKDKFQDVLWVGTDGQGAYMYFVDGYSIKSTLFTNMTNPVNNPARGIFIDQERTLWVGTKGDGILKFKDFDIEKKDYGMLKSEHLTTTNSRLNDNSVYVFAPSRRSIMWIGSEEGLNYYSYKDKEIKNVPSLSKNEPVRYVHAIYESNDTTLWIATVGGGIVKTILDKTSKEPLIRKTKKITIQDGLHSANYFFTIYPENDSIIWFGNRGYGAFRMNTTTDIFDIYRFDQHSNNQTLNDIFAILKNDEGCWFGTSYGLVHLNNENEQQVFNETNGFPNNTIHGVLQDKHGDLWSSTNRGLVKFNMKNQTFQTYNQQNGLEVIEFSDGALYKDSLTGTLFFGGINGFVTIREDNYMQNEYVPPIQFDNLTIFGKKKNIYDFMSSNTDNEVLQLNYSQNFFGISFIAIDYINGNNYSYFYKLNELSDNWIENGNSNIATFTNISPGSYTLSVKYRNNITGKEGEINTLRITILPPWYMTWSAYLVCFIVFFLIIYISIHLSRKWYDMKKNAIIEKLNRRQKEEIYESRLRFFTHITHELCTPLTLIYGPCKRIISYEKSDSYISKYASIIMQNAEKLNILIQELIEFRRLETGNKSLQVHPVFISKYVANLTDAFQELAESRHINYLIKIEQDIYWNTDVGCFNKIINNLISNAFKHTQNNDTVKVDLFLKDSMLHLVVSNTGKGIKEENYSKIFDRHKILDDFEQQSDKGETSRNGLGMAICHNMVTRLKGEIKVKSVIHEFAEFHVILPNLQPETALSEESHFMKEDLHNEDKEFFDRMLQIITEKIDNPDLNVELLGKELGISTRQLYRKLKNVTEKTPNRIIRELRLTAVEKLLVSSNFSVDEIMYKTGFGNRGNFFKLFAQHYGTTPKKYRESKRNETRREIE